MKDGGFEKAVTVAQGYTSGSASQLGRDGVTRPVERCWIGEVPVALEFNGLAYAVMMATPNDLEDFVLGFALCEGLARSAADIGELDIVETDKGIVARAQLAGLGIETLTERVRMRVAESSCGLCGIENLEALAKPLPRVEDHAAPDPAAIFRALDALESAQPLARATGAAHAAAFADERGALIMVREDVGRHNAIDKLVGALAKAGHGMAGGFVISTARCSYEIVEKIVRAGGETLVTVSLPTSMAVQRARGCGLMLFCLAREDSVLEILA